MTFGRLTIAFGLVVVAFAAAASAGEESPTWLALAGQDEPAPSASAPAGEAPAAEAAPASWPPGLLMNGLGAIGARKPLDDLGLRVWGFVETGFTGRLTGGQDPLPLRFFDARRPNNLTMNQLRLTIDRPYDSAKQFDIGGRVDALYGGDAMLTRSYGMFPYTGSGEGDNWFDLVQGYGQLWFKTGADSGAEVAVGKFVTTLGAEVIDGTGNALYSRSYLFNFAIPLTHTGVKVSYVFNSQYSAYFAIVNGWDDFRDNNNAHSYMFGGAISGAEQIGGHARTTYFLNLITGPEQPDNVNDYRTVLDQTLTYWWTEKLSQSVNVDYGTEENVPDVGRARWYGFAHYLTYVFNDYVSGTWRAEWMRDDGGSRTGVDGSLYENTWGLGITPARDDAVLKDLLLRPEIRWDFADGGALGGGRENQVTAAMDVIFKF